MKKELALFIFSAFSLLLLCSCDSTPREKNETEILDEITQRDQYISEYDLSIDSYTVTKRQTNPDNKTDYVWISLTASNDIFTYTNSYELMYVLYNDGWLLEDYDEGRESYEINNYDTITQADADQVMASSEFEQWEFYRRENSTNQAVFYYTASISQYYLKTEYLVAVLYEFRPNSLWGTAEVLSEETQRTPDLLGEWAYQDDELSLWMNIASIDWESGLITLEYRLENVTVQGRYSIRAQKTTISSDGLVTLSMGFDRNRAHATIYPLHGENMYSKSVWMYFGETAALSNAGVGSGVTIEGHWLTRS